MRSRRALKYAAVGMGLCLLMLIFGVMLGAFSTKPEPMPNPNGYDEFLKASSVVQGDPENYTNMSRAALKDLVGQNKLAIFFLEKGISNQCRMPLYHSFSNFASVVFPHLYSFNRCECLLCAEGRLAELEGRTNDSIRFYLDGIRFSQDAGQGGVFIVKSISIAYQAVGVRPLGNLRTNLDARQCAHIAHELESVDAQEETDDQIYQHAREFSKSFSIRMQLFDMLNFRSVQADRKKHLIKIHAGQSQKRQMMLIFAARAYELEHGKSPPNTAALVPEYLKKIPQDPTTGSNLVLQAVVSSR